VKALEVPVSPYAAEILDPFATTIAVGVAVTAVEDSPSPTEVTVRILTA
jgi:hypothetical protein